MTRSTDTLRIPTTIAIALILALTPLAGATALFDDGTLGTSGDCEDLDGPEKGCIDWTARSNARGVLDEGLRVSVSPDGQTVYVLAREASDGTDTTVVHAIDADTGDPSRPAARLEGHTPDALAVGSNDGTVYVSTHDGDGTAHIFAWETSTQGDPTELAGAAATGVYTSVLVLDGGSTVCGVGSTTADLYAGNVRVACAGTAAGTLDAEITVPASPERGSGTALFAKASADGSRIFLTAASEVTEEGSEPTVYALDPDAGTVLWSHTGASFELFTGLDVPEDGAGLYVTGYSLGPGQAVDVQILRLDPATGQPVWTEHFDQLRDIGTDILVDGEAGRVYTTGTAEDTILTLAHDTATGEELWAQAREGGWNGAGWEIGRALALSPDGSSVYTMGTLPKSDALGGIDYAVIGYETTTGEETWYNTYDGPGNDFDASWDMAIAPDGSALYVTGQSFDSFGAEDRVEDGAENGGPVWYPQDSEKNSMATVAFDLTPPVVHGPVDEARSIAP